MPLILSMKEGEDFYVGDIRVVVKTIYDQDHFLIGVEEVSYVEYDVLDDKAVEILPDVMVSAGNRAHSGVARVAISAPLDHTILRGRKYREQESCPV